MRLDIDPKSHPGLDRRAAHHGHRRPGREVQQEVRRPRHGQEVARKKSPPRTRSGHVRQNAKMAGAWLPVSVDGVPDHLVVFDGVCILCSRSVRFVAGRDAGQFSFVQVQSPYGRVLAARLGIDPDHPQTNAVLLGGIAYFKSDAVLAVLGTLPRLRWLRFVRVVPRSLRDWLYDRIAGNRYRLFGRTESCMIPPPGLTRRVLHDIPN